MDASIISPSGDIPTSSSSNASSSPITVQGDGLLAYGSNIGMIVMRLPTDDELRYEGTEKLIQRLRTYDSDCKELLMQRSRVMKDVNRRLQFHLMEVQNLQDVNQKLQQEKDHLTKEKDELGGMCCFLDDDRDKAKKMAQEWKIFGRYATGVLQKEFSQCHSKIRDLEQKQQSLLLENRNLKELCLLLDQEQAARRTSLDSQSSFHGHMPLPGLVGGIGTRDSGDGSSNGSTASNCSPDHRSSSTFQKENALGTDGRENYVRYLENKIRQFEVEANGRLKRIPSTMPTHSQGVLNMSPGKLDRRMYPPAAHLPSSSLPLSSTLLPLSTSISAHAPSGNILGNAVSRVVGGVGHSTNSHFSSSSNPETLMHTMKVLNLHDQLDEGLPNSMYQSQPMDSKHLNEQQKEIVREMCNMVWRKLGDSRRNNDKLPLQSRTLQHRSASMSNL